MAEDRHDEDSADRDVKLGTDKGGTGIGDLFAAAKQGNVEVVQALLCHGADVNKSDENGRTALFVAAEQGHVGVVQALLKNDFTDVNVTDKDGRTALHFAANQGNVEVIQALLKNDFTDVNVTDKDGRTALHFAANEGNVEVIRALLTNDFTDVNVTDKDGRTALHFAANEGNVEVIQALLKNDLTDVNVTDKDGRTALSISTEHTNVEVAQALLKNDLTDVNVTDKNGNTALHFAADQGNVGVIRALLSGGADANMADIEEWFGQTPLFAAAWQGSTEAVEELLSHGADVKAVDRKDQTALHLAAGTGNVGTVRTLLGRGADANKENRRKETPLFLATLHHGDVEVVQALLDHGADVNKSVENCDTALCKVDKNGRTALFVAAEEGNVEVVQALLSHGADVNKSNESGRTALFAATRSYNGEVVKSLLSHGADVNLLDEDGRTALLAVAMEGREELVQPLLSNGTDMGLAKTFRSQTTLRGLLWDRHQDAIKLLLKHGLNLNEENDGSSQAALLAANIQEGYLEFRESLSRYVSDVENEVGQDALFAAVELGNEVMVQALLSHCTDVSLSDKNGRTALSIAARQGNVEVVQALLSHGADVNKSDEHDRTALFLAAEQGNVEMVEVLLSHGADVNKNDRYDAENRNDDLWRFAVDREKAGKHGKSALFAAAEQGNAEVVRTLLSHDADVNNSDGHGRTALFAAAGQGNVEVVQALLSHGADVNESVEDGRTALFLAAEQGNVEVVQNLLSHGADVSKSDRDGETALFAAARQGSVEVVQALLGHGADVNKSDRSGRTALFAASRNYNGEVVKSLLSHGADVNKTNHALETCLFAIAWEDLVIPFSYLGVNSRTSSSHTDKEAALVIKGCQVVIESLVTHGVNVNGVNHCGNSVVFHTLHLIGERGFSADVVIAILKHLHQHGADFTLRNAYQESVFVYYLSEAPYFTGIKLLHTWCRVFAFLIEETNFNFPATLESGVKLSRAYALFNTVYLIQGGWSATKVITVLRNFLASRSIDFNARYTSNQTLLIHYVSCAKEFEGEALHNLSAVCTFLVQEVNFSVNTRAECRSALYGESALFCTVGLIAGGCSANTVIAILKHLRTCGANLHEVNRTDQNILVHYLSLAKQMEGKPLQNLFVVCKFLVESFKIDVNPRPGHNTLVIVLQLCQSFLSVRLTEELASELVQSMFGLLSSILESSTISKGTISFRGDTSGDTLLHLLASLPFPHKIDFGDRLRVTVEKLLSFGGQVNSANALGQAALHVAQTWAVMKVLLDNGAAPNARDQQGNTPLLSCIRNDVLLHQSEPAPKYLVSDETTTVGLVTSWNQLFEYGFDPLRSNDKGETALSLLLESATFDVIRTFLEATEPLAVHRCLVDSNGDTPLHVMCRDGKVGTFWKLNLIDTLVKSERSIVNFANRMGETALHILCQTKLVGPLCFKMTQRLLAYGADTGAQDGKGRSCLDLVANKSKLTALLEQGVHDLEIEPWLPWESKSEMHKTKLGQVARGQNSQQTSSLCYHTEPIGLGAFGRVHAGINSRDGREVAVKCVEKARMWRPEDRNEIKKLLELADCKHVVRYLNYHDDNYFLYIVLELMEGTLEELLDEGVGKDDELRLCRQILEGVEFLHCTNIIHRDIKPTNVLYKHTPELCVKLADFGLSGRATQAVANTFSVMHSKAGTRCWMAPELLTKDAQHSPASDVFACGLLLHFVLSAKKHPFAPTSSANKNELLIECETVTNIEKRTLSLDESLSSEATHLVDAMLQSEKDQRPSAAESLRHPLFWSNNKKARLLFAVGDTPEFEAVRRTRSVLSPVEQNLERNMGSAFRLRTWDTEIPQIYLEMTSSRRSRSYYTTSAVDLVRFVRNTFAHLTQLSPATHKRVKEEFVFLEKFPTLLMNVYRSVMNHNWDRRPTISSAMTEES